jgi:hypothetical protein
MAVDGDPLHITTCWLLLAHEAIGRFGEFVCIKRSRNCIIVYEK